MDAWETSRQDKLTERSRKGNGLQREEGNRLSKQAITSGLGEGKLSFSNKPDYTISLAAHLTVLKDL